LTQDVGFQTFPSISSDGTQVAFISHTAYNDEIWRVDLKGGKRSLLSTTVSGKFRSQITPDGSQVFYGERAGNTDYGINVVSVAGSAPTRLCEKCDGWVWDWSPDRRWLLTYRQGKTTVATTVHNLQTGKSSLFLERPSIDLYEFRWSPDGRWLQFGTSDAQEGNKRHVYVAPFTGDVGPVEDSWIPITDGSTFDDKLRWSPNGNWIYTLSDRDGFRCIWAYRLDPQSRKPAGAPLAVFHSHGARLSINNANSISQELSVARDKIVLNLGEITGNIWMTELQEKK
jgi:Tol biopolymer transport system component